MTRKVRSGIIYSNILTNRVNFTDISKFLDFKLLVVSIQLLKQKLSKKKLRGV